MFAVEIHKSVRHEVVLPGISERLDQAALELYRYSCTGVEKRGLEPVARSDQGDIVATEAPHHLNEVALDASCLAALQHLEQPLGL